MRLLAKLFLFGAVLFAINGVVYVVLSLNLANGVYPVDADSIGIPLYQTWCLSKYAAIGLLVTAVGTSIGWKYRKAAASLPWRYLLATLVSLAYLCVIAFFALWGVIWLSPDHYSIAATYAIAVIAIASIAIMDVRRTLSNQ